LIGDEGIRPFVANDKDMPAALKLCDELDCRRFKVLVWQLLSSFLCYGLRVQKHGQYGSGK